MDVAWGPILLWVGAPIAVVSVVVVIMTRKTGRPPVGGLSRVESYATSLIGAGGMLVALLSAVGLVGAAFRSFGDDPFLVNGMPFGGGSPAALEGVEPVVASGFESVWIEVAGLPAASRWLFFLEAALPSLAAATIGVAVAGLAIALIRDRPFARSLPNVIGVAAVAVLVAGLGSQAAGAFARATVVDFLGVREVTEAGADGSLAYFSLALDLAPVGWAFALALIAAAFQIGYRLQRDTEALV